MTPPQPKKISLGSGEEKVTSLHFGTGASSIPAEVIADGHLRLLRWRAPLTRPNGRQRS
jgi:hypothetical protein